MTAKFVSAEQDWAGESAERSSAELQIGQNAPIDAVVYEIHPALAYPPEYPYAPQPKPQPSAARASDLRTELTRLVADLPIWSRLGFRTPAPAQYYVPQRFGLSAILGIMTAIALLFGGLQFLDAAPVVYLFFGLQAVVICLAQMFSGNSPRIASSAAGAVMAPLFALELLEAADINLHVRGWERAMAMAVLAVPAVPIGAFLGYLTGTCAAGVFLVMDLLEQYWTGRRAI